MGSMNSWFTNDPTQFGDGRTSGQGGGSSQGILPYIPPTSQIGQSNPNSSPVTQGILGQGGSSSDSSFSNSGGMYPSTTVGQPGPGPNGAISGYTPPAPAGDPSYGPTGYSDPTRGALAMLSGGFGTGGPNNGGRLITGGIPTSSDNLTNTTPTTTNTSGGFTGTTPRYNGIGVANILGQGAGGNGNNNFNSAQQPSQQSQQPPDASGGLPKPLPGSSRSVATGTGTGATGTPGSIPQTNPYGSTPFASSPGYTGPYGPGSYNPQTFATQGTAQQIASQYGGTVISNPSAGLLGAAGSPFQTNQSQYMVQLANGTIIDPAKIASLYANAGPGGLTAYDQAQVQDILNGSNGAALNQAGMNGVNQQFPAGTPINTGGGVQQNTGGYTPSSTVMQQWLGQGSQPGQQSDQTKAISSDMLLNPFNVGTGNPLNNTGGGNTNGVLTPPPGGTTPPPTDTTTPPPGGSTLDQSSLNDILTFLSAYGGLGSGAGNPQAVNQNGQLSNYLGQILSGIAGGQDLYNRRKQYSAAP